MEELSLKNWTFTYIGADHDVEKFAVSISITNTMQFNKNEADMKQMFVKEQNARMRYSQKIRSNENTSMSFYDEEEDLKKS